MKKTMRFLSMVTLVAMGTVLAGCAKMEDDQPQENNSLTLTATLSFNGEENTKALTSAGVKTFAEDDQIVIFYIDKEDITRRDVSDKLTAGDIHDDGKKADIKVALTYTPKSEGALRYVYPANMAKATIDESAEINDANTIDYTKLDNTQDGTLTKLGSDFDLCTFDGNFSNMGELPASATLTNRLTILALTFKNSDSTPLDITGSVTNFTLNDGANSYAVSRAAAAGPIYVAIRPVTAALIYNAETSSDYYNKTATSKEYLANNFYNLGLRMSWNGKKLTAAAVNDIVGSDGHAYPSSDYDKLPTGVTAVARVCYKNGVHGLALALQDEARSTWSSAGSSCSGKTPVDGCTWRLPNVSEYNSMISAVGGVDKLCNGFSAIGGTNLIKPANQDQTSAFYWTSNTYGANAYSYNFISTVGDHSCLSNPASTKNARACLSF